MSIARLSRDSKRQLGQFFTPPQIADKILGNVPLSPEMDVLEPSFGDGALVFALLKRMARAHGRAAAREFAARHLFGCELDSGACAAFAERWSRRRLGPPTTHLAQGDFFRWMPPSLDASSACSRQRYFKALRPSFDLIIGNPPFGGTIAPDIQDDLDAIFGLRNGIKIKKETYAFFLVKCLDLLRTGGTLVFICSDTMLSIQTMAGLRRHLLAHCAVAVGRLPGHFEDNSQRTIVLTLKKQDDPALRTLTVFGRPIPVSSVEATPNHSWLITDDLARYFTGPRLGDKLFATAGMTVGRNDLFLREVDGGAIVEPFQFSLRRRPVTLERERSKARLGVLSPKRQAAVAAAVERGDTEPFVAFRRLPEPRRITLPHPDYRPYNKACNHIVFTPPRWMIFWRHDGEYVYTFKRSGNWYLHGAGGKAFYGREGLTWALIAPRLYMRYLPPGYVFDTGAPCAFPREGVPRDEMFFLMGWCLTDACNRILKTVINHTRNIQSKDFERLPSPAWVPPQARLDAIALVKSMIARAQSSRRPPAFRRELARLERLFMLPG